MKRDLGLWLPLSIAVLVLCAGGFWQWQQPKWVARQVLEAARQAEEWRELDRAEAAMADVPQVKRKRDVKGKLMADIIVQGAGDESYNGEYFEAGTYNGKPYYHGPSPAEDRYLFWATTVWVLGDSPPDVYPPDYVGNPGADLPANDWTVDQGTPPAPSLTLGAAVYDEASGGDIIIEGGAVEAAVIIATGGGDIQIDGGAVEKAIITETSGGDLVVEGGLASQLVAEAAGGDIELEGDADEAVGETVVSRAGGEVQVSGGALEAVLIPEVSGGAIQVSGGAVEVAIFGPGASTAWWDWVRAKRAAS